MKLHALAALAALTLSAGGALAEEYPHEPPRDYLAAPPGEWEHRDFWHRMDAEHRRDFWAEHRRESWRCDHGDHAACGWLHEHEG